jgi:60 kDa SS-A/Ro ribonucleoprotein
VTKYTGVVGSVSLPSTTSKVNQVVNSTGGYVFQLAPRDHFIRFLILGSDTSTYYASAQQNFAKCVVSLRASLDKLGKEFVDIILDISTNNRAPKVDPAIFAMAFAVVHGSPETRAYALSNLGAVCRIGTHLFSFLTDVKGLGGHTGGRAFKRALTSWYLSQAPNSLAYQLIKYRNRSGWSHADVLRLCKPSGHTTGESDYGDLFAFATDKKILGKGRHLDQVTAFLALREGDVTTTQVVDAITKFGLPREAVPDQFLKEAAVWKALVMPSEADKHGMPMTALVRTLNRITAAGLFEDHSVLDFVVGKLTNEEGLRRSRIHPISLLIALKQYEAGKGEKGSLTWNPKPQIVTALEAAFNLAFKTAPSTGKSIVIGLDVSGSMSCAAAGTSNLSSRDASVALAKFYMNREANCKAWAFSDTLTDISTWFEGRYSDVVTRTSKLPFMSTNPGLVIQKATRDKIKTDLFLFMTDSEVNSGSHVHELFRQYCQTVNPNAKFVMMGMAMNTFTLADPSNPRMMDVAGFDASVPEVLNSFING